MCCLPIRCSSMRCCASPTTRNAPHTLQISMSLELLEACSILCSICNTTQEHVSRKSAFNQRRSHLRLPVFHAFGDLHTSTDFPTSLCRAKGPTGNLTILLQHSYPVLCCQYSIPVSWNAMPMSHMTRWIIDPHSTFCLPPPPFFSNLLTLLQASPPGSCRCPQQCKGSESVTPPPWHLHSASDTLLTSSSCARSSLSCSHSFMTPCASSTLPSQPSCSAYKWTKAPLKPQPHIQVQQLGQNVTVCCQDHNEQGILGRYLFHQFINLLSQHLDFLLSSSLGCTTHLWHIIQCHVWCCMEPRDVKSVYALELRRDRNDQAHEHHTKLWTWQSCTDPSLGVVQWQSSLPTLDSLLHIRQHALQKAYELLLIAQPLKAWAASITAQGQVEHCLSFIHEKALCIV